ncbi:MAG: biopolymer transporter ExbD [Bacteriovoracaceae bacterium]|nr:biopolymer transporter ExbD [Bacteriovoracaceae bacterium]
MAFSNLSRKKSSIAEINMTPFVDVMLVLLVIFMVTAPMMYNGIKLTLPKTQKVNTLNLDTTQLVLSVNEEGKFFLGQDEVLKENLIFSLKKKLDMASSPIVYIRAHYDLKYEVVAKLMTFLKEQGVAELALVTEIENKK